MPYKIGDKASLPTDIQKLPAIRRRQFVHVFNSMIAKCKPDDKECESHAHAGARSVVKSLNVVESVLRGEKAMDPKIVGIEWANLQGIMDDLGISSLDFGEDDFAAQTKDILIVQDEPNLDDQVEAATKPFEPEEDDDADESDADEDDADEDDADESEEPEEPGEEVETEDSLAQKAVWSTAFVNNLPDSSFLYVESGEKDGEGKTTPRTKRHFPYKDASGSIDIPHLRNAIGRIPQSTAPGLNKDALQKRAQSLLETANKDYEAKCMMDAQANGWPSTFGVPVKSFAEWDQYEKQQQIAQKVDTYSYRFQRITDNIMRDPEMSLQEKAAMVARAADDLRQYVADDGTSDTSGMSGMSGMKAKKGFWQKAVDAVRGKKPDTSPITLHGTIRTVKDASGQERWFTAFSNKWEDREKEIVPEKAHKSYVEYVNKTGKFPELQLWHTPGTRIGIADYVDYDTEGFAVASGLFDTGTEHIVANLKAMAENGVELGVSHGFFYTKELFKDNVYGDYDTDEISILPMESVANTGTLPLFNLKEFTMTLPKRQFLIEAGVDDEVVKSVENGLSIIAKNLGAKGVAFREVTAQDQEQKTKTDAPTATETKADAKKDGETPTDPQASAPAAQAAPDGGATLDAIMAGITALTTQVSEIKSTQATQADEIKALKATDDEKIAAQFQSKANKSRGAKDSESSSSELSEEEQAAMNKALEEETKDKNGFDGPAAVYAMQGMQMFDPDLIGANSR